MFQTILVPVDGSPLAEQALHPAAVIARGASARVQLMLVHQPLPMLGFADTPWSPDTSREQEYLRALATDLGMSESVPVEAEVAMGDVVETICDRAREIGVDLIVMTSHGRTGLRRVLMGSVAQNLIRQCDKPIVLLRSTSPDDPAAMADFRVEHILVTLDGSSTSEEILDDALELAQCMGARLSLLRVVPSVPLIIPETAVPVEHVPVTRDEDATRELREVCVRGLRDLATRLEAQHPTLDRIDVHAIVSDDAADTIVDFARTNAIDLIAMSTHGRGLSRLFLGSVANAVASGSTTPMLLRRSRRSAE